MQGMSVKEGWRPLGKTHSLQIDMLIDFNETIFFTIPLQFKTRLAVACRLISAYADWCGILLDNGARPLIQSPAVIFFGIPDQAPR